MKTVIFENKDRCFACVKDIRLVDRARIKDKFYIKQLEAFEEGEVNFPPYPYTLDFIFEAIKEGQTQELRKTFGIVQIPCKPFDISNETKFGKLLLAFGVDEEAQEALPNIKIDNRQEVEILKSVFAGKWAWITVQLKQGNKGYINVIITDFISLSEADKKFLEDELKKSCSGIIANGEEALEDLYGKEPTNSKLSEKELKEWKSKLSTKAEELKIPLPEVQQIIKDNFGTGSTKDLNADAFESLIDNILPRHAQQEGEPVNA